MSVINAAAPYRRDDRQAVRVPVVMPLVEVEVDEKGSVTVKLDHEPYSAEGSLTREDLQRVLDEVAADLGTAVRVEVHEADGNTFTDIVTPDRPRLRMVQPVREAETAIGEVAGGGFLPPALLEAHPGLVLFIGKRSGTVMVSASADGGAA